MRTDVAYLRRLDDELHDLPRARREEILGEIREHIAEADPVTEAELREVLDRLGDPEDIAADARERFGTPRGPRMGAQEIFALLLMTIGSFLFPVIGWIIGIALLWGSSAWSRRDKWVGTLLFPGGFGAALLILAGSTYVCFDGDAGEVCTGEPSDVERYFWGGLVVFAVFATIFSAIYLARRARRGAY